MSSDPFEGLKGSRRSKSFYPGYVEDAIFNAFVARRNIKRDWPAGMNGDMFRQDFSRVMPSSYRSDSMFRVTASDDATAQLIAQALPGRYGPNYLLTDAVSDFVDDVVYQVFDGPAAFEIELFSAELGGPTAFRLDPIPNGTTGFNGNQTIQFVPPDEGLPKIRGVSYVGLDPRTTVRFDLPKPTYSRFKRANRLWRAAERTSFKVVDLVTSQQNVGFEFDTQDRQISAYVLRHTSAIGWDGRGLFTREALDPFKAHLRLRLVRNQILVRDHILDQLRQALLQAGALINRDLRIGFDGLRTEEDVQLAESSLKLGNKPITELIYFHP